MTEKKHEADYETTKQVSSTAVLSKILFFILLLAVIITMVSQFGSKDYSDSPISNKTYIELPDRKQLPIVKLKHSEKGQITTEILKGKWHLLFFGYTFCPDVCPVELTVLHEMTDILRHQIPQAQLPQTVFVSIDPERDTPEKITEYVTYFDTDFIGVTGKQTDLKILTMPLGISWIKEQSIDPAKKDDPNYLLSHSTTIILLDPDMRVAGLFLAPHSAEKMAQMYQKIVQR